MNIIAIGDVVGKQGCEFLRSHLPYIKRLKNIDLCIANGENSAPGNGLTPDSAQFLFDSGVDLITTGNHVYNRNEVYDFLDARRDVIRPANYSDGNPTGEKRAMVVVRDVRVSAGVGTLTHVLTADEQILPRGTAYITDIGMTGPKQSVLGVKPESIIKKMRSALPTRFEVPNTDYYITF